VYRFTGIGRIIDPRYPSNRFAILAAVGFGLIGFAVHPNGTRLGSGIVLGGSAFLAWALARELDPDRVITSYAAAVAGGVAAWVAAGPSPGAALGAIYLLLVALRITVRTTGRPPTVIDLAGNIVVAGWLARGPVAWLAGLVLAVAVVRDTRLADPAPPINLALGGLLGVGVLVVAGLSGAAIVPVAPPIAAWALVLAGAVGGAVAAQPEPVISLADSGKRPIDPVRLSAARWTALAGATLCLVAGVDGLAGMGPVWATLALVGLVRVTST
jgi:hypothetical protein